MAYILQSKAPQILLGCGKYKGVYAMGQGFIFEDTKADDKNRPPYAFILHHFCGEAMTVAGSIPPSMLIPPTSSIAPAD